MAPGQIKEYRSRHAFPKTTAKNASPNTQERQTTTKEFMF
jgi:hypothetical protein